MSSYMFRYLQWFVQEKSNNLRKETFLYVCVHDSFVSVTGHMTHTIWSYD